MAESQAVAKQALKKLEDQLTCAICLEDFKEPKLLQCFHVYCKDCLQRLVVTDRQGQLSLGCPTCRQSTLLSQATGVSGLQPAFHIHHLMEIQEALEKVKQPKRVMCGKCKKAQQPATSYCRDCGDFICAMCTTIHSNWDDFSKHKVLALEELESKVKQMDSLKKVFLFCDLHKGKELELYCETCEELICTHCTVKKHRNHQYDLISDMFEKQKAEIEEFLEPIERQLGVVKKMLTRIDLHSADLNKQRVATKTEVKNVIRQLHLLLDAREVQLSEEIDEIANRKLKNLATQKGEVETTQTQLVSCLSFVKESLRTGSQGEVMRMKKTVVKQIKEMTASFKPDMLTSCRRVNIKFTHNSKIAEACQQFGNVHLESVSPQDCYATGKGLKLAKVGEPVTAIIHNVSDQQKACATPVESLQCELVTVTRNDNTTCTVKALENGKYQISYQPTSRGRHQLHIKVEGEHIKGSPFSITVKLPVEMLGTPVRVIEQLDRPSGVAVNQRGEIIIAEYGRHCISVVSWTGEKLRSFGSKGSGQGQFRNPRGVAVDDDGNILVVDSGNNRIQVFTSDGKFMKAVGKGTIDLNKPIGISIHPHCRRVFVSDHSNHRIQILNPDLTFNSSFGSQGDDDGQTTYPWDVAFDSAGCIYQGGQSNNCIQVFNAKGQFLRKFGSQGRGRGELNLPSGIAIDREDVVYIAECYNHRISLFTMEGTYLASFGSQGNKEGQLRYPYSIAVDDDGFVYVSDYSNGRIQIF